MLEMNSTTQFLFNIAPNINAIVAATNNSHKGIPVLSLNADAIILSG